MTERSDRIRLATAEPRCEPSQPCTMRIRCARAWAALDQGSPMADYSLDGIGGGTALCPGYLSVDSVRKQPAPVQPPRVHPPLRGGV